VTEIIVFIAYNSIAM